MRNLTLNQLAHLRRLVDAATVADCNVAMDVGVLRALLDDLEAAELRAAQLDIVIGGLNKVIRELKAALMTIRWKIGPVIGSRIPQQGQANRRELRETLEAVFRLACEATNE